MEMEEAREEGESRVVAEPEESEEEKFRSRYIWSTSIFPKCTAPSGVVDRIAELTGQGVKLFIRVGDKLWKHLRVHQDLAVGQHLLPLWLLPHLFFFYFFLLLTFFHRVNMGRDELNEFNFLMFTTSFHFFFLF